jgi:hypothetical protein
MPVDPVVPLLVPPTPGLLGEVVLPVPEELVPVPEELVPVPEELVPVPEVLLPVPELPVLLLRSWRRQSSFAMPVSTSQRLELELAPLEVLGLVTLGLEVEPVLGLLVLGLVGLVVELLPLGLVGLVVELLPLGLEEVWAMERLAAPRNAAATAA